MIYLNGYSMVDADRSDAVEKLALLLDCDGFVPIQELGAARRRQLRRTGAFHSAAVMAAVGAGASDLPEERLASAEIILVSCFGDQDTTGSFIDDLIDFGMEQGSPIKFAHSNHNTAAAYVAKSLNAGGAILTMVNFTDCFRNALQLALAHLNEGLEQDIILVRVESKSELSKILKEGLAGNIPVVGNIDQNEKIGCEAGCLLLTNIKDNKNLFSLDICRDMACCSPLPDLPVSSLEDMRDLIATLIINDDNRAFCLSDACVLKLGKI